MLNHVFPKEHAPRQPASVWGWGLEVGSHIPAWVAGNWVLPGECTDNYDYSVRSSPTGVAGKERVTEELMSCGCLDSDCGGLCDQVACLLPKANVGVEKRTNV